MTVTVDVLVVGGGPAGLSASLILGRCRRSLLVCDKGEQRNLASLAVHGLLGREGTPPTELLAEAHHDLAKYPSVAHRPTAVTGIEPHGDVFCFHCADGTSGSARKVLLATGLTDHIPEIDGVEPLYGRSVHHCLYCDGYEHRDRPLAAYGLADKAVGLALMMKQWSQDIILCTNGTTPSAAAMERLQAHDVAVISKPVACLQGSGGYLERIWFNDGAAIERKAMFFATGCHQQSNLSRLLGCARDEKGGIITNAQTEETSITGVYAAGDESRDVLLVAVAIAEGAKAGVAINKALLHADGLL